MFQADLLIAFLAPLIAVFITASIESATSFYFVAISFSDFNVSGLFRCFSER
ncbi:MAG: hypothetical protein UW28_C0009G0013 [Parcubacteria group bacterium GW2011_GWA2_44_13]|nr:MAG: hypothetical protein UW28_C0009G0013 [Parcubacteria group bacterium GW2011_GWA2_44_13]